MNYWQFKVGMKDWNENFGNEFSSLKIGSTYVQSIASNAKDKPKDNINDIVFIYNTKKKSTKKYPQGIYLICKIIENMTEYYELELEVLYDLKENPIEPENFGFEKIMNKIHNLHQNGTYYKFQDEENPKAIYNILINEENSIDLDDLIKEEINEITQSIQDTSQERMKRIKSLNPYPKKIEVKSYTYKRNPDIVAEALFRAEGKCARCDSKAPFIRKSDNTPYLEVHHLKPLAKGGKDELDNVIALCPNCHRKEHFG